MFIPRAYTHLLLFYAQTSTTGKGHVALSPAMRANAVYAINSTKIMTVRKGGAQGRHQVGNVVFL